MCSQFLYSPDVWYKSEKNIFAVQFADGKTSVTQPQHLNIVDLVSYTGSLGILDSNKKKQSEDDQEIPDSTSQTNPLAPMR